MGTSGLLVALYSGRIRPLTPQDSRANSFVALVCLPASMETRRTIRLALDCIYVQ